MLKTITPAAARIVLATLLVCGAAALSYADNAFWHGVRSKGWHDGKKGGISNWYSKAPPTGNPRPVPDDTAVFAAGSLSQEVTLTEDTSIQTIRFVPGVEEYLFTLMGGELQILGKGIINQAGSTPSFKLAGGQLTFKGEAAIAGGAGGILIDNAGNGTMTFDDDSNGGSAFVTNAGGIEFRGRASAKRMFIDSTGNIEFFDSSDGNLAEITNERGGRLRFRRSKGPDNNRDLTIGSISNTGLLDIGRNTLAIAKRLVLHRRSQVLIDIGERTNGSMTVVGNARLGGNLILQDGGNAHLNPSTRIVLLRSNSRVGEFEGENIALALLDRNARISYDGGNVVLELDPLP